MFRINRIGPAQISNMENQELLINGTDIEAAAGALGFIRYLVVGDAIAPQGVNAHSSRQVGSFTLNGTEAILLGVKINSRSLIENRQYLFGVSGAMRIFSSDDDVDVFALLGHCENSGESEGILASWTLIPHTDTSNSGGSASGRGPLAAGVNMTTLTGNWLGRLDEERQTDLIFGFVVANSGADVATFDDWFQSVGIQRYEEDLSPFDPNR